MPALQNPTGKPSSCPADLPHRRRRVRQRLAQAPQTERKALAIQPLKAPPTVAEPGICGWVCQIPGSATGCCCATKGAPPVLSAAAAAPAAPGRRPPVAGSFVLGAAGGWWSAGVGLGQVVASPDVGRGLAVAGAGRDPRGERRLTRAGSRGCGESTGRQQRRDQTRQRKS